MSSEQSSYTLALRGSLTTSRSEAVHAEVLEALRAHPAVVLDCSAADEIDVTFLQILIAAGRMAASWNKAISLSTPPAGLLANALARCGFALPVPAATSLADVFSHELQAQS